MNQRKELIQTIVLDVKPYCDSCRNFEADSNTKTIYACDEPVIVNTVVTCKHAQKCAQIERCMKERALKDDVSGDC